MESKRTSKAVADQTDPTSPLLNGANKRTPFILPTRPLFRYIVLGLICMICFGAYYSFDEIEPIEKPIKEYLGIRNTQFGLLYSVYSIPNVILPLLGGTLADALGLRMLSIICSLLVTAGTLLVALGFHVTPAHGFVVVVIGRSIFGYAFIC